MYICKTSETAPNAAALPGNLTATILKNAKFEVYESGSHGLLITQKDKLNADLLAFLQS